MATHGTQRQPTKLFLTRGLGVSENSELESFEEALRQAGIATYNLDTYSSIFPPYSVLLPRKRGIAMLGPPGTEVNCVMARISTNEYDRRIAAAIGLAIPTDRDRYGYISESHRFGVTHREIGDFVEDMAVQMLGTTLGIDVDPDAAYDERTQTYKLSGRIIDTRCMVQAAKGQRDKWTTAVAAAVFCDYKQV